MNQKTLQRYGFAMHPLNHDAEISMYYFEREVMGDLQVQVHFSVWPDSQRTEQTVCLVASGTPQELPHISTFKQLKRLMELLAGLQLQPEPETLAS